MRFFIGLAALFVAVSALEQNVDSGTPTRRSEVRSIWPPIGDIKPRGDSSPAPRDVVLNTNAKRLAAGLRVLPPRKLYNPDRPLAPRQTGAPPAGSSCIDGVIFSTFANVDGYLTTGLNSYGAYTSFANTACDSNVLHVCASTDQPSTPQSITTVNGVSSPSLPYFGACVGQVSGATMGGSSNYVDFCNTAQSDASTGNTDNSFTVATGTDKPAESEVWLVGSDGAMTVQWVNPDGTSIPLSMLESQGAFVATGDIVDFYNAFGFADNAVRTSFVHHFQRTG
ncbi:hypothetical protein DL93DRAFT_830103 [Clavulina sp. PMI_390]|nr:hypothetical protein DL93DRAFT_830103 [Clavulina sp. PMI_390]